MTIFALGINHRTASLDIREKVAFAPEQTAEAIQQLCDSADIEEVAILSTCNRTEIYGIGDEPEQALAWLADYHRITLPELHPCHYLYRDNDAVRHLSLIHI